MTAYRGRRAASIENGLLRVTVLEEGGHIAEVRDLASGINPLWTPPWPSIEPSGYDPGRDTIYGGGADASLLAGIMGHNLCLDIFGGPSDDEAAAGLPAHGEAGIARFEIAVSDGAIAMTAVLPAAQLRVERKLTLAGRTLRVRESVENLTAADRPVGWTQHVTIGPPFLEGGRTRFALSADRSLVYPGRFGPADYLDAGAEFAWPRAPRAGGGEADLATFSEATASSAYTAHRMNPLLDEASFIAFSPSSGLAFGYAWRRSDFPWLGMWEENRSRTAAPWNGEAMACGLEFGVSPLPETRRQMIERGPTLGTPGFRWLPAGRRIEAEYRAVLRPAGALPAALE